ncbi:hypothetical protein Dimus_025895 [Dionaea muscipula]
MANENWQEQYLQLQVRLRKLDQLSQENSLQIALRSLSSTDMLLNWKSEQSSFHWNKVTFRELIMNLVKELQRVRSLNVLGKLMQNSEQLPVQQDLAQN